MKIALVGCGAIGRQIAKGVKVSLAFDIDGEKGEKFAQEFGVERAKSINEILGPGIDLVVEAASQQAAKEIVPAALAAGKNVVMMSTGALADDKLLAKIRELALQNAVKVYLPSGAIAGLDGIKSAAGETESVTITTTKPPKSLEGAPFFSKSRVELGKIGKKTLVYEGNSREAAKLFPANVNVAATLAIAGIGMEKTKVRIFADPTASTNRHEIEAKGKFGSIHVIIDNVPSPQNPKTSYLAALSAIATIRKLSEPVQAGT